MAQNRLYPTIALMLILAVLPVRAAEILVIGDSWADPIGEQLRLVLAERGHADTRVLFTKRWGEACALSTPDGLEQISDWIGQFPTVNFVHFSLGGNDIINRWTEDQAASSAEDELVEKVASCMETVFDHLLSIHPEAQIVWSSYDYLRPIRLGSPPQINSLFDKLASAQTRVARARGSAVHVVDIVGTLQRSYGFDGVQYSVYDPPNPIPPGDPSLPDPSLPSPHQAFRPRDPTHPTSEANRVLATAQYEKLYRSLLVGQAFQINRAVSDAWFHPATAGQGFKIIVWDGIQQIFLSWFTYDAQRPGGDVPSIFGEAGHRWLTAQGPYEGDTALLDVHLSRGGVFDQEEPAVATPARVGTIEIIWSGCNEALLKYDLTAWGLSGEIPLERIVLDNVAACEAAQTAQ
jgi:hypothetical protein